MTVLLRRRLTPADALSHPFFSAVSPARALLAAQAAAARHTETSSEAAPEKCAQADGVGAAARLPTRVAEVRAPPVEVGLGFAAAARGVWAAAGPCAAATDGGRDVHIAWAQEGPGLGEPEAGMDAAFALEAQSATTVASSAEARALGAGPGLAPDAAQGPADRSRPQWHATGHASPGSDAGQSVAPEVLRPAPVAYAHAASAVMGTGQGWARTAAAYAAPPSPAAGGAARQLPSAAGSAQAARAPGTSPAVHRPAPGRPAGPPEPPPAPRVPHDAAPGSATPAPAAAERPGAGALGGGRPHMQGVADGAPGCLAPANLGAAAETPGAGGGGRRSAAGLPAAEEPVPGSAATPVRTRRAWEAVSALLGDASPGATPGGKGTLEMPYVQRPLVHAQQPGAVEPGTSPSQGPRQALSRQRPATPGRLQQPLLRGPAGRAALAADSELTLSGSGGDVGAVESAAQPPADARPPQLGARARACGGASPDGMGAPAAGAPGLQDPGGSAAAAPAPDPGNSARRGAPATTRSKLGAAVLGNAQMHEDRGRADALAPTHERPPGAAVEAASATGRRSAPGESLVDAQAAGGPGERPLRQRKRGRSEGVAPGAGRAPPLRSPRVGTQAPASAGALTPGVPAGRAAPPKRSWLIVAGAASPAAAAGGAGGLPPGGQAAAPAGGSPDAGQVDQGAAEAPRQRRGRASEKQAKPWWVV